MEKLTIPSYPIEVKGDTDAALDFLRRFSPEYTLVLTAIAPDGKIDGDTFHPDEFDTSGREFIEKYNGKSNLYFGVNPVRQKVNPKAKKSDIHSLCWLHVDVDPEPGKSIEEEQERILNRLKKYQPHPTAIIFSGGGYQAFWKLKKPVIIKTGKGWDAQIAELERYNKQLEIDLGGDNCHNIDRIMRLPGTVNLPNEVKKKKGRKPALAREVDNACV